MYNNALDTLKGNSFPCIKEKEMLKRKAIKIVHRLLEFMSG